MKVLYVDDDLHYKVKVKAIKNKEKMEDLVKRALEKELDIKNE